MKTRKIIFSTIVFVCTTVNNLAAQSSLHEAIQDAISYMAPGTCVLVPGNPSARKVPQLHVNFSVRPVSSNTCSYLGTMSPSDPVKMIYSKANQISPAIIKTTGSPQYTITYQARSSTSTLLINKYCEDPSQTFTIASSLTLSALGSKHQLILRYITNGSQENTLTLTNSNTTVTRLTSNFTFVPSSGLGTIERQYAVSANINGQLILFNFYLNFVPEALGQISMTASAAPSTVSLPFGSPPASVQLSSTATSPNGAINNIEWTQTSGTTAVIASPRSLSTSVTGLPVGTYGFQLAVRDVCNVNASRSVTVRVEYPRPIARAGTDLNVNLPSSTVRLDGSASSSANGGIRYNWVQSNGPSQAQITSNTDASPLLSGLVAGTYNFRLTITDAAGLSATDDVRVIARQADLMVTASPFWDANSNGNPSTTTFQNAQAVMGLNACFSAADGNIQTKVTSVPPLIVRIRELNNVAITTAFTVRITKTDPSTNQLVRFVDPATGQLTNQKDTVINGIAGTAVQMISSLLL